jgi:hypothetical protein
MVVMRASFLLCLALLVGCLGCKGSSDNSWLAVPQTASNRQATSNLAQFGLQAAEPEERIGPPAEPGKKSRKLVYHADMDMMVENLTAAERALDDLLKAHDAVLANAETVSRAGAAPTSVRRLRVPVASFDAFLVALGELGEVQRSKLDVQDVTRSHSELEEQIRNLAAEAKGLRDLLEKPSEKLADRLAVREQLSKVTREKATLEARLRRMREQAEYSTVTLRMLERSGYLATGTTPLGTSASRAFWDSWAALVAFGQALVLFAAMVCPWLPLLAVAILPLWAWRRRRRVVAA